MNSHQAFMLLLLSGGAFLVPLVSERIGWFAAPLEILYGALIANFVPGANEAGNFISSLSNFGLLLLLFLAGLEIDFKLLKHRGRAALLGAVFVAVAIEALGLGISFLVHLPLIIGILLGAMSISLILTILQQGGLSQSPIGQTILLIGIIGEFCTILMLTGFDLVNRLGLDWPILWAVVKLAILLSAGYAAMLGLGKAVMYAPQRFARLFAERDVSEVGVRGALALMLSFAAMAVLLDVEQVLATFIAGAICSFAFRSRNVLAHKLSTMGQGFFLPIFFITVGLQLRLGDLFHPMSFAVLLLLMGALLFVRLLAIPVFRFVGLGWREALPIALLLSAPLTMQVAIIQVGIDLGQVDSALQNVVLGAAIGGAVLFPLLARPLFAKHMLPKNQELSQEAIVTKPQRKH